MTYSTIHLHSNKLTYIIQEKNITPSGGFIPNKKTSDFEYTFNYFLRILSVANNLDTWPSNLSLPGAKIIFKLDYNKLKHNQFLNKQLSHFFIKQFTFLKNIEYITLVTYFKLYSFNTGRHQPENERKSNDFFSS